MLDLAETLKQIKEPIVEDPGGPYLFVDLYPLDFDDPSTRGKIEDPPWEALLADPRIFGAWLKCTDGVRYGYADWFVRNFQRLAALVGDRRGTSFLLGGYHYLQFAQDPVAQADFFVRTLFAAGYSKIDMIPVMDVEFGAEHAANQSASNEQIVDCASAFAERTRQLTGRRIMLYGRGLMRDRSITSKMGCDCVCDPSYTRTLVLNGLVGKLPNGHDAPWQLDDVVEWQYCGDGTGENSVHRLPLRIAGHGVDLSVAIDGARKPTLAGTILRST